MPTYVVLMNWTEQGIKAAKDTVNRYETARDAWESSGVTIRDIYWTIGPHDIVCTVDAPDDETLSGTLLGLAGAGNLRTTTMSAFSADEMRGVLGKIPS
jgi:uncharacterized protein with GYD domain